MLGLCITGFAQHMKKYKSSCRDVTNRGVALKAYAWDSPLFGYKACRPYYGGGEPPVFIFVFYFFPISISWDKTNQKQNNDNKKC